MTPEQLAAFRAQLAELRADLDQLDRTLDRAEQLTGEARALLHQLEPHPVELPEFDGIHGPAPGAP